jgi:hypothetical protein
MPDKSDFETQARRQVRVGFAGERWGFLKQNKKWWPLPILVTLLLVGALILPSGTAVAPFIYTLF